MIASLFARMLLEKGFTAEEIVSALEDMERRTAELAGQSAFLHPPRSAAAERQARYRERNRASRSVTGFVTRHNNVTPAPPLPPSPENVPEPLKTTPSPIPPSPKENPPYRGSKECPLPESPDPILPPAELLPPSGKQIVTAGPRQNDWPADGFEVFWRAYPRRTAKGSAVKAFAKAARTARLPFSELLAAVSRYAATADPQFTAHPATWLNQERWHDEPSPRGQGPPRREARGMNALTEIAMEAAERLAEQTGYFDEPRYRENRYDPGGPVIAGTATPGIVYDGPQAASRPGMGENHPGRTGSDRWGAGVSD